MKVAFAFNSLIQGFIEYCVFFEDFIGLSRFLLGAGEFTESTAAELAEFIKLKHFKKKHNIL